MLPQTSSNVQDIVVKIDALHAALRRHIAHNNDQKEQLNKCRVTLQAYPQMAVQLEPVITELNHSQEKLSTQTNELEHALQDLASVRAHTVRPPQVIVVRDPAPAFLPVLPLLATAIDTTNERREAPAAATAVKRKLETPAAANQLRTNPQEKSKSPSPKNRKQKKGKGDWDIQNFTPEQIRAKHFPDKVS